MMGKSEGRVALKEKAVNVNRGNATTSGLKRQVYREHDEELVEGTGRARKQIKLERCGEKFDKEEQDKEDVSMCYEYSEDIFEHLYARQFETSVRVNYVTDKEYEFYLRPTMRAILVDWLIEVHCKFRLFPETLYLGINLMDRYLSENKVSLSRLQLIAITALLVAAKFEEVNLPKLSNYSYITDNAYTNEEIKQAEFVLLNKLDYNLGWPNPLNFLRRLSKCDDYDSVSRSLGKCLLEYMISCPHFIDLVPSKMASVAMFTAQKVKNVDFEWTNIWDHYSLHSFKDNEAELQSLSQLLINDIAKPSTQLNALIYKYKKIGVWGKISDWCLEHSTNTDHETDSSSSSASDSSFL